MTKLPRGKHSPYMNSLNLSLTITFLFEFYLSPPSPPFSLSDFNSLFASTSLFTLPHAPFLVPPLIPFFPFRHFLPLPFSFPFPFLPSASVFSPPFPSLPLPPLSARCTQPLDAGQLVPAITGRGTNTSSPETTSSELRTCPAPSLTITAHARFSWQCPRETDRDKRKRIPTTTTNFFFLPPSPSFR